MTETYTLFELNEHIRRVIALNFREGIWVACEVAQARFSRGHCYLELIQKDDDTDAIRAQSNGVLWARTHALLAKKYGPALEDLLQDGVSVRILVRVDFHERYGLKLVIDDIDPEFTIGNLERKRRQILEELKRQGLLERNGRLPYPLTAQRIAVLSAQHAAGYQDFRQHLKENPYGYAFMPDLYPVALQGSAVEEEIVAALSRISRVARHYDCVVIIRGGGSRIDLGGFDSFAIGEAIAHSPLPVFTGIGHEIDTTVADAAANTAFKTPTAVADALVEINARFEESITETFTEISAIIDRQARSARTSLQNAGAMLTVLPRSLLREAHLELRQILPQMTHAAKGKLRSQRALLDNALSVLQAFDPANTLQRGFSITRHNGKIITDPATVRAGDLVESQLAGGTLKSKVQ